tara:strand:+ start:2528 stop:2677 length:150 start_codon:yes stop_codon:yes gene_type:complete
VSGVASGAGTIKWSDIDDQFVKQTATPAEVDVLAKQYLLCVSGDQLEKI